MLPRILMINIQYHQTNIGELILGSYGEQLCMLDFRYRKMRATVDQRLKNKTKSEFIEQNDAILHRARQEIDEYLKGTRTKFDYISTVFH